MVSALDPPRYRPFATRESDQLTVAEPEVIRFLQTRRDNGVPAWQRWQAARAVEAYRQHILNR